MVIDFEKIKETSLHEKKTIEQLGLKLAEETGECTQAILSYTNASGCGYKELSENDVKEECIDTILVALSIYYRLGAGVNESKIESLMTYKVMLHSDNTIEQLGLELVNKTGKCVQAILSYTSSIGSTDKNLLSIYVKEKCIDIYLGALAIYVKLAETEEESVLIELINKKLNKWRTKTNMNESTIDEKENPSM